VIFSFGSSNFTIRKDGSFSVFYQEEALTERKKKDSIRKISGGSSCCNMTKGSCLAGLSGAILFERVISNPSHSGGEPMKKLRCARVGGGSI
jgi:hypothetical protein